MSFLFRSISRFFSLKKTRKTREPDDIDDLPPRLQALVNAQYPPFRRSFDLPVTSSVRDPAPVTDRTPQIISQSTPSNRKIISINVIAALDLASPTTPPSGFQPQPEHQNSSNQSDSQQNRLTDSRDQLQNSLNQKLKSGNVGGVEHTCNSTDVHNTKIHPRSPGSPEKTTSHDVRNELNGNAANSSSQRCSPYILSNEMPHVVQSDNNESVGVFEPDEDHASYDATANDMVLGEVKSFDPQNDASFVSEARVSASHIREHSLSDESSYTETGFGDGLSSKANPEPSSTVENNKNENELASNTNFPFAPQRDRSDWKRAAMTRPILTHLSERVSVVNALVVAHKAPQVVLYACSDTALMWLHTPPPPPVTMFLVDDMADVRQPLSYGALPLLPNNVKLKHVRAELDTRTWDTDLVVEGFDWHLPSMWIVHMDVAHTHFSSFEAFDMFLRIVHGLTNIHSTIVVAYPLPSFSDNDDAHSWPLMTLHSFAIVFTPEDFAIFVGRRSFRVLSDRSLDALGESDMHVAALAHATDGASSMTSLSSDSHSYTAGSEKESNRDENREDKEIIDTSANDHSDVVDERDESGSTFDDAMVKGSDEESCHTAESDKTSNEELDLRSVEAADAENAEVYEVEHSASSNNIISEIIEEPQKDPTVRKLRFELAAWSTPEDAVRWSAAAVVIGSDTTLGCWDPRRARRMEGNLHDHRSKLSADVEVNVDTGRYEYKYALVNEENQVVAWEVGENRIIDNFQQFSVSDVHVYDEVWRH